MGLRINSVINDHPTISEKLHIFVSGYRRTWSQNSICTRSPPNKKYIFATSYSTSRMRTSQKFRCDLQGLRENQSHSTLTKNNIFSFLTTVITRDFLALRVNRAMRVPNMCLVLKLDNGKVVSIADEQTDGQNHPVTHQYIDVVHRTQENYNRHLTPPKKNCFQLKNQSCMELGIFFIDTLRPPNVFFYNCSTTMVLRNYCSMLC